jgi:hypothetical protein
MTFHGFTGSREELTIAQQAVVSDVLATLNPEEDIVVVGGCVGLDAFVGRAAKRMGLGVVVIIPGIKVLVDPDWRQYADSYVLMPDGSSYRARNARLVGMSDVVHGFPRYGERDGRATRSGTWQTIRMARKGGKIGQVAVLDDVDEPPLLLPLTRMSNIR